MTKHRFLKTKTWIFLICIALVTGFCIGSGQAATPNDQLPTKDELRSFAGNVSFEGDYSVSVISQLKEQHHGWKCDRWEYQEGNETKTAASLYYSDPESSMGYGSIYYDSQGHEFGKLCWIKFRLLESYQGVENSTEEVVEQEVEQEVLSEETYNESVSETTEKIITESIGETLTKEQEKSVFLEAMGKIFDVFFSE